MVGAAQPRKAKTRGSDTAYLREACHIVMLLFVGCACPRMPIRCYEAARLAVLSFHALLCKRRSKGAFPPEGTGSYAQGAFESTREGALIRKTTVHSHVRQGHICGFEQAPGVRQALPQVKLVLGFPRRLPEETGKVIGTQPSSCLLPMRRRATSFGSRGWQAGRKGSLI